LNDGMRVILAVKKKVRERNTEKLIGNETKNYTQFGMKYIENC